VGSQCVPQDVWLTYLARKRLLLGVVLIKSMNRVGVRMSVRCRNGAGLCREYLEAPIPDWVKYSETQIFHFGSPDMVEEDFVQAHGKNIPDDYLEEYESMLDDINSYIQAGKKVHRPGIPKDFNCSIFRSTIYKTDDAVVVSLINTRPCAERLGVLRIFFWQVMKSTAQAELDFIVENPLRPTRLILRRISPKFHKTKNNSVFHTLSNHWLKQLLPKDLGLEAYIMLHDPATPYHVFLNHRKFPEYDDLNSQKAVNERESK